MSRYWRTAIVLETFVVFAFFVYLDWRGWLGGRGVDRSRKLRRQAERLRGRLLGLGPAFIKIGQMLSTRADLLPVEYIDELSHLQDRVPPFPSERAMEIIESELGRPVPDIFASISDEPVAAASLGQVYRARLHSGEDVAVKVQRPDIDGTIEFDIELMRRIARFIDSHPGLLPGTEWAGAIDEFDRTIHEEIDYRREAGNAERFRANFREWSRIFVPPIHHGLSSRRVLTMGFVEGTKVTDLDGLRKRGLDARKVNELIYQAYFKQLLEDGFFHADPHPGNLLVMRDGRLAVFDFGMCGEVPERLQRQIIEAFFHLFNRDIPALVDDMIGLGFLAPHADVATIREVVGDVFRRKLNLRLREVSFRDLTYDLAPVVYNHPITTPSHFTYMIRALMTLEGVSIVMNPDFNFFEVAAPYLRGFVFRRDSARLRKMVFDSLSDARTGRFNWSRLWGLARMAYSLYIERA